MQIECRISSLLEYFAEMKLIFCKDNANRMQNIKFTWIFCWDEAYLLQRYIKYLRNKSKIEVFFVFLHSECIFPFFWSGEHIRILKVVTEIEINILIYGITFYRHHHCHQHISHHRYFPSYRHQDRISHRNPFLVGFSYHRNRHDWRCFSDRRHSSLCTTWCLWGFMPMEHRWNIRAETTLWKRLVSQESQAHR